MLLSGITLRNLLWFRHVGLKLGSLNVLIGPNASGKSNLVNAVTLLRAAPLDLQRATFQGANP